MPNAIDRMLYHDALFQRFHGLVDEGYIVLKKWNVPTRIALADSKTIRDIYTTKESPKGRIKSLFGDYPRDEQEERWLTLAPTYKSVSTPTQISDLVRFVVLHQYGGVYLDMDVLLLRDLRPLLLPNSASSDPQSQPAWAEQWVEQAENPGDYNTAVLSLPANSSISSYLLRGGARMGMNYHPRVLGQMLWKDGRNSELAMLHNAVFDPLVTDLRRQNTQICTVPCHKNFKSVFMREVEEPGKEWGNYQGSPENVRTGSKVLDAEGTYGAFVGTGTNRSMRNFFRGAFAYHIHNQVSPSRSVF